MISVSNFSKTYENTVAVNKLSFDLQPGTILGMVGQNGAGKTTTLRSLAGIIPPTEGKLCIDGHNVVEQPIAAKKKLAYIPDEPKLFESLTVWEHLRFYGSAFRVSDWEEKSKRLMDTFELSLKRNSTASELSRGMRQKVAITCRFLYEPKVILFDEPHTGLDPQGIRVLKQSIEERSTNGAAVVISSHLLSLIEDLCTHLLIMDRGEKRFFGELEQLRQDYPSAADDNSLEEIFFQATSGPSPMGT